MPKILIIEDDKAIVDVLKMILEHDGFIIEKAYNGPDGIQKFKESNPDIVLLDIRMPKMDGIEVLQELRKIDTQSIIIMISGHGNIETAVQTTKLGAYDFISKPFDVERLKLTIQNGLKYKNLLAENENIKRKYLDDTEFIGNSEEIKKLKEQIIKIANSSSRVLITGENGTGKELAAVNIHKLSSRADNSFIHLNCAIIPKDLIEVELFGCVEGYLPFSPIKKTGKFELANKGTLFLDEIADLNLEFQTKLLNVLNENKIEPLGSNIEIPIDVRIISSTNRNLEQLIIEGKFREDLYHRLNVLNLNIPPLRNRKEDIPELIIYFSKQISIKNNLPVKTFTESAIEYLSSLKWQGNVRELKNTIERLIILSDSNIIDKNNLIQENKTFSSEFDKLIESDTSLKDFQDITEKIFIQRKLEENKWNVSKTAESLKIQRSHLYTKIKQFNIENPDKKTEN
jgi:DNA-binding NtrC family response regulator